MINRSKPISVVKLQWLFNELGGYYNFGNQELAGTLLNWDLLNEINRKNEKLSYSFLKWSFTVSYLELINALQWFSAGILLHRKVYLPAQIMQMYYYSIFFSCGSFLAANGKGHYTVKEKLTAKPIIKPIRKVVWFEDQEPPFLSIANKDGGGEHEFRAKWFYEVINSWDEKDNHQTVLLLENDRVFHTEWRNLTTYSLPMMAEELHHNADYHAKVPDVDTLIKLWNRDEMLIDYFPEEFWVFEHMKVPLYLHVCLLESYKGERPFTQAQIYITETLLFRHKKTGIKSLIIEILNPILNRMKIK